MLDLGLIKARLDRASSSPWVVVVNGNTVQSHAIKGVCSGISPKTGNADFIAHAREDIPALVDEVEQLRQELLITKETVRIHAKELNAAESAGAEFAEQLLRFRQKCGFARKCRNCEG